jgi:competence protein ComEC
VGRPALFAAFGLALGIALASAMPDLFLHSYLASVLFFAILAFLISSLISRGRAPLLHIALLFAALVLFGGLITSLERASYHDTTLAHIADLKPPKAILTGTLTSSDERKREYLWTFETDSLGIVRDSLVSMKGRVVLHLPKNNLGTIDPSLPRDGQSIRLPKPGSRLRVYCSLEPFRPATNPYEFASDLKLQTTTGAAAQGYVHSRFDYYLLPSPELGVLATIDQLLATAHKSILTLLDTAIRDKNSRGFVEAVVLGDRSDMDKETLDDFTTSGVAYILAVSGFNVAIVSLVIAQLLRIFGIYGFRTRISITMLMVLLYSAIVGFQPSVVRALLMIELYLLALLLERKPDPLNIVMSAAAINLLVRPYDLFDVGFQLSYAGVLGMILIAPKIRWLFGYDKENEPQPHTNDQRLLHSRFVKQLGIATTLTLGASIFSYPIIAAQFYRVSFVGLLAALPLIPLSALITAFGFLLIPITLFSKWLGQLYGDATGFLSQTQLVLTKLFAHVPAAAHSAASPSWIFLALLVASMFYCLWAKTRSQLMGRVILTAAFFLLLWEIGIPFTNSVLAKNKGKLQVLFFDVGQGDCIFFNTPSGKNYFVDFGKVDYADNAVLERTALPFLRAENITHIDAGFISHMHIDHIGGAPTLLHDCSVASILTSGERVGNSIARELDTQAREQHIATRILSRGDTVQLDSDLVLYVLSPDPRVRVSERTEYGENIHDGMLAFKLVYRNTSFLFLGDIERSEEETMLAYYGDFLRSNVVKVAHHGSLTSSSKEFVLATHPEFAVISVGEHNNFGHPAPAIVKRWMTSGANVLRTDHDGAVLLTSDGNVVKRVNWR